MLRRHAKLIILCSCLVSHSLRLGNRRTQKRLRQRDVDVNPIEQISLQVLNKHLPQNHEQCHLSSLTPLPPTPPSCSLSPGLVATGGHGENSGP